MQVLPGETLYIKTSVQRGLLFIASTPLFLLVLFRIFEEDIVRFVMSLFTPEPDKGYLFYRDFLELCVVELVWFAVFTLAVLGITRTRIADRLVIASFRKPALWVAGIILLCFAVTLFVAQIILEDFPNSSDEYAYLFQAETLGEGKLWQRAPLFQKCFHYNHIVQNGEVRVGRFPPGWPIVLSSAFWFGFPAYLVNPALGVLCLLVTYFFVRRYYNNHIAVWTVIAMGLTGFFIFNAASYFSHVSCMLACLLFVFAMYRYFETRKVGFIVVAGVFLGCIIVIRYFTAVLIFLPFLIYMASRLKTNILRPLVLMGVGAVPFVLFLAWYNATITGNPFLPVTMWLDKEEGIGFVKDHTFLSGVEHIVRWLFMFAYWVSPGFLLLYFLFLWRKRRSRTAGRARPEDYFFITLMAGYFFYYQIGGNQYGPRFMFEAFPFLIILVVRNVIDIQSTWIRAAFLASVLYAVAKFPFVADREATIVDQRQDVYDLVAANDVHNAVVLIESHTSPLRPMPVGDLTRNSASFDDDVLYAHDCEAERNLLMNYYTERSFYIYRRDVDRVRGELIRIR